MDYEQHMPGRSSYDPSRARAELHREGGVGGILFVVAVIVAALALVMWLAGGEGSQSGGPVNVDPAVTAPVDGSVAPSAVVADPTAPAASGAETATAPVPSD